MYAEKQRSHIAQWKWSKLKLLIPYKEIPWFRSSAQVLNLRWFFFKRKSILLIRNVRSDCLRVAFSKQPISLLNGFIKHFLTDCRWTNFPSRFATERNCKQNSFSTAVVTKLRGELFSSGGVDVTTIQKIQTKTKIFTFPVSSSLSLSAKTYAINYLTCSINHFTHS